MPFQLSKMSLNAVWKAHMYKLLLEECGLCDHAGCMVWLYLINCLFMQGVIGYCQMLVLLKTLQLVQIGWQRCCFTMPFLPYG